MIMIYIINNNLNVMIIQCKNIDNNNYYDDNDSLIKIMIYTNAIIQFHHQLLMIYMII